MTHVSTNQKGFGVVEILIALVVVVVIGVVGFVLVSHKSSSSKTSTVSSTATTATSGENNAVIAAAYKYCATLATAAKKESFFLSSIQGKTVVYSDNGSTARVSGACYDMAGAVPATSSTYVFTKDASGSWSFSKLTQ